MPTDDQMEREANYFAMCLLIPADLLAADIKKLGGIDLHDGKAIANWNRRMSLAARAAIVDDADNCDGDDDKT